MKKLLLLPLAIALGCGPREKEPIAAPTEIADTVAVIQTGARNSISYLGRYKGKTNGVETSVELAEDFSYVMTTYAKNGRTEQKGTFRWNSTGDSIVLKNGPHRSVFFVGQHYLMPSDAGNSNVTAWPKQSESEAAKSDGLPGKSAREITGVHWKLSEVNGKPIRNPSGNDYFIQLNSDGTFGAYAGCNRMGGKFERKGSKILMSDIVSTMMACPEMQLEDEFKQALESADNYVSNEKVLQFRRAGANLLKFEAFATPKPR